MTDLQPADWELPVSLDPEELAQIEAAHARINAPGERDALETRKATLQAQIDGIDTRLAELAEVDAEPVRESAPIPEPEPEAVAESPEPDDDGSETAEEEAPAPKAAAKKPATRKAPAKKVDKPEESA